MRRWILFLWLFCAACSPLISTRTPIPSGTTPPITLAVSPAFPSPTPLPTPIPATRITPSPTVTPTTPPTADLAALQSQIDGVLARYPADWHILVKRVAGRTLYSTQAGQRIEAASTIKIPIAMLFFKSVEVVGTPSLEGYLAEKGIDGRTYQQLLHAMLVVSEEDATDSLVKAIRESRLDVKATLNEWGAAHTDIFLRKTTVEDIAALIDGFYAGERLLPPARQIMLNYMAEYTSADNTRIGVIRGRLPCWGTIYNKRGTITTPYLAVADVAIVEFPSAAGERAYTIALFAYPGKSGNTYESLVQGMETLAPVFWQAIRVENGLPESGCGKP